MTTSDSPSSARQYNTRLGLKLFVVYLLFYLGFVLINAFAADLMETVAVAGLNLEPSSLRQSSVPSSPKAVKVPVVAKNANRCCPSVAGDSVA